MLQAHRDSIYFPVLNEADGRLPEKLKKRGLLEGFQVTAEGKPCALRDSD
jgi:hypothetical protein